MKMMLKVVTMMLIVTLVSCGSWDAYIDILISHTKGHCDQAAIIGIDGSVWTSNSHPKILIVSASEAVKIGNVFKSGDFTEFQVNGIRVGGEKYRFIRGYDNIALGKLKDLGSISLQSSKSAVVIGHTKEGGSQGYTNRGVAVIADYLESLGM